jgi:hypothetical protein
VGNVGNNSLRDRIVLDGRLELAPSTGVQPIFVATVAETAKSWGGFYVQWSLTAIASTVSTIAATSQGSLAKYGGVLQATALDGVVVVSVGPALAVNPSTCGVLGDDATWSLDINTIPDGTSHLVVDYTLYAFGDISVTQAVL